VGRIGEMGKLKAEGWRLKVEEGIFCKTKISVYLITFLGYP
jgi:hypothetical protein